MADQTSYKAVLSLPRSLAEKIAAALSELYWPPADAVGLFDNEDGSWRVEATFSHQPDEMALKGFFDHQGAGDFAIFIEAIPDADWVSISQAGLHPVRAGRFIIHGSHDRAKAHGGRWAIEIEAGQAFGTAHHGSTLGCLKAIDDLAKKTHFGNVLDIGTGTGVLAIAAARAWRAKIIASDLDPIAQKTAQENISRYSAAAYVQTITADGLAHPLIRESGPYDLVIANILASPLISLAHGIAQALRPGGIVILSGITREQAGRVAAAYGAAGFTRLRLFTICDWVTLTLRQTSR
jgi:ribosomal protein L11 methyltransferase